MFRFSRALVPLVLLLPAMAPGFAQARHTRHDLGRCWITGYVYDGSYTATGTWPRAWSTVAVDPNVIPLGAFLSIGGLGSGFHAEDTGGDIKGCRVDVFVRTVSQAYALTGWRSVTWWR